MLLKAQQQQLPVVTSSHSSYNTALLGRVPLLLKGFRSTVGAVSWLLFWRTEVFVWKLPRRCQETLPLAFNGSTSPTPSHSPWPCAFPSCVHMNYSGSDAFSTYARQAAVIYWTLDYKTYNWRWSNRLHQHLQHWLICYRFYFWCLPSILSA